MAIAAQHAGLATGKAGVAMCLRYRCATHDGGASTILRWARIPKIQGRCRMTVGAAT